MNIDPAQALQGIRVVELASGMPGEVAGLILAHFGADVVKVEPPGGSRSMLWDGFEIWNASKRRLALDLQSAERVRQFYQLVAEADVLLRGLNPATVKRLSLDAETLAQINPRLIQMDITGFDANTPYADLPGWDGLVAAKMGRVSIHQDQGERNGPVFPAVPAGAYGASQSAVQGILAALRLREHGAGGAQLRTSLTRGMYHYDYVDYLGRQFENVAKTVAPLDANGRRIRGAGLTFMVATTSDGHWIQFANVAPHLLRRKIQSLGLEKLYDEPEFANLPVVEPEYADRALRIIMAWVRTKTLAEWQAILDANGNIGYEVFRHPDAVLSHPQIIHDQQLRNGTDGRRYLAAPWKVNGTLHQFADATEDRSAPSDPVHPVWNAPAQIPSTRVAADRTTQMPPTGELLRDVTILEIGTMLAGPYAGRILADYGARVIKIEEPTGDPFRNILNGLMGASCLWGKESIALDLKDPFGQEVLEKLIRKADVLYHSFRPGVPERLGFGWERLHQLNPQMVFLSAFGLAGSGPLMGRPSYDPISSVITGSAVRQGAGSFPTPEETAALPQTNYLNVRGACS